MRLEQAVGIERSDVPHATSRASRLPSLPTIDFSVLNNQLVRIVFLFVFNLCRIKPTWPRSITKKGVVYADGAILDKRDRKLKVHYLLRYR